MSAPTQDWSPQELARQVDELVDECRRTCLWYKRRDFYPRTLEARLRVLEDIQRHSDRATYVRAARLKECLSQTSSGGSAGS